MNNKKWIRVLAVCLVAASLLSTVAAAVTSYTGIDFNGDGITNIFDAQVVLFNNKKSQAQKNTFLQGIVDTIFGREEMQQTTVGGVTYYEVDSALDLYKIAIHPGNTNNYILTEDIDLGGADWTPVINYGGTFNGNNHTISNFKIEEQVANRNAPSENCYNMGFFGDTQTTATVKDLHLSDFVLDATNAADAQFIGCVVGGNRGVVTGCTVDGRMIDPRESATASPNHSPNGTIYRGFLVGRNIGTATLELDTMQVYAPSQEGNREVAVAAIMGVELAEGQKASFAGYAPNGTVTDSGTTQWQDVTYQTELSAGIAQKRQTAVDYMRKMATVKWTPEEDVAYLSGGSTNSTHSAIFKAGTVYTGLPYNHNDGNFERFYDVMVESGSGTANDPYVVGNGMLVDGLYEDAAGSGFIQYMGNDCGGAVEAAWATVSPVASTGKAYTQLIQHMVPNDYNYKTYGAVAVGGYSTLLDEAGNTAVLNGVNSNYYDNTVYLLSNLIKEGGENSTTTTVTVATVVPAENNEQEIIKENVEITHDTKPSAADMQMMAAYYAQARYGDAVVTKGWPDTNPDDGIGDYRHARMLSEDPVIIRNADFTYNLDKSYVVTIEQGDGLYPHLSSTDTKEHKHDTKGTTGIYRSKATSWRTDYTFSLKWLMSYSETVDSDPASLLSAEDKALYKTTGEQRVTGMCYVPVTIDAFKEDKYPGYDTRQGGLPYVVVTLKEGETDPVIENFNDIYSHYHVISATLVLKDAINGTILKEITKYNNSDPESSYRVNTGPHFNFAHYFENWQAESGLSAGTYELEIKLKYATQDQVAASGKVIENDVVLQEVYVGKNDDGTENRTSVQKYVTIG